MSLERTAGSWTGVARILALIAAGCLTAVAELDAQAGQADDAKNGQQDACDYHGHRIR